jgi:DNA ligase (NAD+)
MALGAKVSAAVSSKTDAVFVGEDPGSKLDDARKHGVRTYDIEAVRRIMSI